MAAALDVQVGGAHYKDMPIQPVEFIHRNGIGFCEGAAAIEQRAFGAEQLEVLA